LTIAATVLGSRIHASLVVPEKTIEFWLLRSRDMMTGMTFFGVVLGGYRRGLADLDRSGRTTSLRTSEARSADGARTIGKRDKWPSRAVVVCCFGEPRIW
jgi:hypothetical protein